MYTQEIICPYCGKKTIVNVADAEGHTVTPCQRYWCKEKIYVKTDNNGRVITVDKVKSGCFITSACVAAKKLDNSEEVLDLFRQFRDTFVKQLPNGNDLITEYYLTAPTIVEQIDKAVDSQDTYNLIFEKYLTPAKALINERRHSEAMQIYVLLMQDLKQKYGVSRVVEK